MTDIRDEPESWIIALDADLNVLENLIDTYDHVGATDEQLAIAWTTHKLRPNMERIRDYLYRKWEDERSGYQASTPAPAKPDAKVPG